MLNTSNLEMHPLFQPLSIFYFKTYLLLKTFIYLYSKNIMTQSKLFTKSSSSSIEWETLTDIDQNDNTILQIREEIIERAIDKIIEGSQLQEVPELLMECLHTAWERSINWVFFSQTADLGIRSSWRHEPHPSKTDPYMKLEMAPLSIPENEINVEDKECETADVQLFIGKKRRGSPKGKTNWIHRSKRKVWPNKVDYSSNQNKTKPSSQPTSHFSSRERLKSTSSGHSHRSRRFRTSHSQTKIRAPQYCKPENFKSRIKKTQSSVVKTEFYGEVKHKKVHVTIKVECEPPDTV